VTEKAPSIEGYKLVSPKEKELTPSEDASQNNVTFYYRKLVSYKVRYLNQDTGNSVLETKKISDQLEGDTVTEKAAQVGGFTLASSGSKKLKLGAHSKDNVITFYYERVVATPTPSYDYSDSSYNSSSSGSSDDSSSSNDVVWAN